MLMEILLIEVATIKINKEDITIPNPPIFSPASGSQTVTISTNHPTQTINIDVEATDDDSGVNRVVMQRPATDNRGIVTETLPANSATNNVYSFTGITYNFADYNTVSASQNFTENILFTIIDNNGKSKDGNYSVSVEREENGAPDVTVTTKINGVDVDVENRIINLSSTNLSDTITFVIDASDVNGIGSISMPGAQLVNSPNVFSKVINYDPAKTSRYGDSGETISFLVIVKDVYNNETQETVSFIVKQNNDAAPIIQDIFLDKTSITLNESNLTNDTVRVTVLATDADFRAVTLPGLGHTLTSPNLLQNEL